MLKNALYFVNKSQEPPGRLPFIFSD